MRKILEKPSTLAKPLGFVGLILVVGGLLLYVNNNKISILTSSGKTLSSEQQSNIYKDGTYNSDGSYNSPAGRQTIGVNITLASDIVTDAIVTNKATESTPSFYQNLFLSDYKRYVIGKNINNMKLNTIAGSSLTPKGFNEALSKIKTQAS